MTDRPDNPDHDPTEKHQKNDGLAEKPERPRVGYKNPPVHTRFQKGQPSRNPKGRPKREKTWKELFRKELNKRIWVEENGKRMRITKRRAWMKRVANDTVMRKPNAVKIFLKFERPGDEPQGLTFYIIG